MVTGTLSKDYLRGDSTAQTGNTMKTRPLSESVAIRAEEMRLHTPTPGGRLRTQEAVAEGIGISRQNYVNKTTLQAGREGWSIDQAEALAEYYRRVTGRRLAGWPFIDEQTSANLDRLLDMLDSQKTG
jgi:hypothetical protein